MEETQNPKESKVVVSKWCLSSNCEANEYVESKYYLNYDVSVNYFINRQFYSKQCCTKCNGGPEQHSTQIIYRQALMTVKVKTTDYVDKVHWWQTCEDCCSTIYDDSNISNQTLSSSSILSLFSERDFVTKFCGHSLNNRTQFLRFNKYQMQLEFNSLQVFSLSNIPTMIQCGEGPSITDLSQQNGDNSPIREVSNESEIRSLLGKAETNTRSSLMSAISSGLRALDCKTSSVSFHGSNAIINEENFTLICYQANAFTNLRRVWGLNETKFRESVGKSKEWSPQGGKSNSYFAKSMDDALIIKEISVIESTFATQFGEKYARYLTDLSANNKSTCLARLYGVFKD